MSAWRIAIALALCDALFPPAAIAQADGPDLNIVVRAADSVGAPVPGGVTSVATLADALDRVAQARTKRRAGRITIDLQPGTHRLERPVRLGPEHDGTAAAPVIIRGAPGLASRIVGSVALRPDPAPVDPALLARMPAASRAHARTFGLPPTALAGARIEAPRRLNGPATPPALEVFDSSGALAPARWPNEGWALVKTGPAGARPDFTVEGGNAPRWRGEPDLWVEGYWRWGWLFEAFPVVALDAARSRLTVESLPYEGILPGARFRLYHALSELDQAGEWWRDTAQGRLVAWPRPGGEALEVTVAESLFRLEGVSHVRLQGLRLERTRGDLITVRGGRDVVVEDSALAWAGGRGAVFEGAAASGIVRCEVTDIGRAGVRLSGGDRPSLTPGDLFLRDSRLTRYARISRTQSPAVEVDGVGATIAGNYIHDTNEYAIHLRGNDHVVEWNEIAHVLSEATDSGAIYAGRDWTARGSVIRHNFIRDVRGGPDREVKGVYLDDMASGFAVRDNLFLRVDQPVFIGGGRDNVVESNLFIASSPAIHVDSRGETTARDAVTDPQSEIRAALAKMPAGSGLWSARYPALAGILADAPGLAKRNRIVGNVFLASQPFRFADAGRPALQQIGPNVGPGGIRATSGADLVALTRQSTRPSDFESLLGPDGRALPAIAVSRMRRSILFEKLPAP